MSQKTNSALIGAFVVAAVALIVAAVAILGSGRLFSESKQYVMFFEGSVNGLSVGAPVAFRGVKIGSVTDIKILLDAKELTLKIPVFVEIDPSRITQTNAQQATKEIEEGEILQILVQRDLRAQLGIQSLVTGQLFVNLDFYPDKPARLVRVDTEYPQIPTIPSPLDELSRTLQTLPLDQLANKLLSSVEGIEAFVNSPELKETVKSLEATVRQAQVLLSNLSGQVKPVSEDIQKTLSGAQKLLKDIDNRVGPLATSIDKTIKDTRGIVRNIDRRIDPLMSTIEDTFKATQTALKQVDETLAGIKTSTGQGSAMHYEIVKTMEEVSAAARSVRVLTDYLERHPEALIRGKGK